MTDEDHVLLRYHRQIMLPEVDIEGQERLSAARVLIIGMGGLGSPTAMYLAAAGVGTLVLVDFDAVELSNLQRQIVHATPDLGRLKVDSARDRLEALNPLIDIVTFDRVLAGEELLAEVRAATVVLDASDNLTTRLAINAACVAEQRPLVSGAAVRWEGQLMVIKPDTDGPCYRCLYRSEEEPQESCAESGVVSPLLGAIGSMQALECFKLITGTGDVPAGRLLLFDALHSEWHAVAIARNPHCPVCASKTHGIE